MTAVQTAQHNLQLQFLRQSIMLEESAAPFAVRRASLLLSALVWGFLVWGGLTEIEEIAQAPGEVVPTGFTQIIQHYDGGIVSSINIEEGSSVEAGDTLLILDGAGAKEQLNEANIVLSGLHREVEVAAELFSVQEKLAAQGLAPKAKYLEAKRDFSQASNRVEQQREVIERLKNRVSRLVIRAPVSGIIKGLSVNTIGEVVKSGDALMELLPVDEDLIVEARIDPSDVGHVSLGQAVKIKVSSYDFGRYGVAHGALTFISATTFTDENGKKYYRGRIELDQNYVGDQPDNKILPGMTIQAGIVTGEKTILEYLLKPIQRALESGLSER